MPNSAKQLEPRPELLVSLKSSSGRTVAVSLYECYRACQAHQQMLPGIVPPAPLSLAKPGRSVTLADAAAQWIAANAGRRPKTLERYRSDVRKLVNLDQAVSIRDVDAGMVRRVLQDMRTLKPRSQESRFNAIQLFLQWCVDAQGYLDENPCRKIHKTEKPWLGRDAEVETGKAQLASKAELLSYLAECDRYILPTDRLAAAMPVLTGMRAGEVLRLRVRDIDWDAGWIWIRGPRLKTRKARRVAILHARIREDLRQATEGKSPDALVFPVAKRATHQERGPKWLNRHIHRTCERAGVTICCTHGLRGTWMTFCGLAGVKLHEIAASAGHADGGKTVARNYSTAPEVMPGLPV